MQTFNLIATMSAFENVELPITILSFGKRKLLWSPINYYGSELLWFVIYYYGFELLWFPINALLNADVQSDRDHFGVRERRAPHDHPLSRETQDFI